jgi:hypothetical protein
VVDDEEDEMSMTEHARPDDTGTDTSSPAGHATTEADRDRAFAHLAESAKTRDFVRFALRHAAADPGARRQPTVDEHDEKPSLQVNPG